MTLNQWASGIETVADWRHPRMIVVGDPNYGTYDRLLRDRVWAGWIGWFPVAIPRGALPPTTLARELSGGTLVASQEANVVGTDPAQKKRAHDLEYALLELGILPTERICGRAKRKAAFSGSAPETGCRAKGRHPQRRR